VKISKSDSLPMTKVNRTENKSVAILRRRGYIFYGCYRARFELLRLKMLLKEINPGGARGHNDECLF